MSSTESVCSHGFPYTFPRTYEKSPAGLLFPSPKHSTFSHTVACLPFNKMLHIQIVGKIPRSKGLRNDSRTARLWEMKRTITTFQSMMMTFPSIQSENEFEEENETDPPQPQDRLISHQLSARQQPIGREIWMSKKLWNWMVFLPKEWATQHGCPCDKKQAGPIQSAVTSVKCVLHSRLSPTAVKGRHWRRTWTHNIPYLTNYMLLRSGLTYISGTGL